MTKEPPVECPNCEQKPTKNAVQGPVVLESEPDEILWECSNSDCRVSEYWGSLDMDIINE